MSIKKTVIVGAGAIGSLIGSLLAESGSDITLCDNNKEKIAAIRKRGICIRNSFDADTTRRYIRINAVSDISEAGQADLILMLVKSFNTEEAAASAAKIRHDKTMILTLQNGFGNTEKILQYWDRRQVLAGVTYHGAYEFADGDIIHTGWGYSLITSVEGGSFPVALAAADFLNRAGLETKAVNNFNRTAWEKLIVNCAINPLGALYRINNGEIPASEERADLIKSVIREAVRVARAEGTEIDEAEIRDKVITTCKNTALNHCSMLADIERSRRTEIEAINGSIVAMGKKHGIETPVNKELLRKILLMNERQKT